jgi:hypothetical protein
MPNALRRVFKQMPSYHPLRYVALEIINGLSLNLNSFIQNKYHMYVCLRNINARLKKILNNA